MGPNLLIVTETIHMFVDEILHRLRSMPMTVGDLEA